MGFDDLPEFPQGGAARAENGNQGIPPEQFRAALHASGVGVIAPNPRPEDAPAVREVMIREADLLAERLRISDQPSQPPMAAPQAPVNRTDTPQAPSQAAGAPAGPPSAPPDGANLQKRSLEDRLADVHGKYRGDFGALAEAYIHSQAQATRASMGVGNREYDGRLQRIEEVLAQLPGVIAASVQAGGGHTQPGNGNGNGANGARTAQPGAAPFTAEEFFQNPAVMARLIDERLQVHLNAFGEAQARQTAQATEAREFDDFYRSNGQKIEQLRPVMDMIFRENPQLYAGLSRKQAHSLLMERAEERVESFRGRMYHRQMEEYFGQNGGAMAPPGSSGTLPPAGAPRTAGGNGVAGGAGAPVNWSQTPNMHKIWGVKSDSLEEEELLRQVLKERGHWENTPHY